MPGRLILNAFLIGAVIMLASCGKSGEEKADTAAAETATAEKAKAVYGKIKEVSMDPQVNAEFAKKGEKIFSVICTACHKYDERYVGPALGKVYNRRTPVYIMNMILDTDVMLEKDDTAHCLLQEYLTKMPNAQVNETDARYVLEHLRDIAAKQ